MASPIELNRGVEQLSFTGLGAEFASVVDKRAEITELPPFAREPLQSPERPRLKLTKVAVISGPSYSGKDTVMQILSERHGWQIYDGTIDDFQRRGGGSGSPIERERRAHKAFDDKQARRFAELKPNDEMWIHQTRLGGIILASETDKRNAELARQNWSMQNGEMPENPVEPIPAVAILLWTSKKVREDRAVEHEKALAREQGRPEPTRKHILANIKRKELDDTRSWRKRFGSINFGSNPFSRYLKRRNGQPVYNRYVITDDLTLEEVADRVEELLIQLGAADIIIPESNINSSGDEVEMIENTPIDVGESVPSRALPPLPEGHPSKRSRKSNSEIVA